MINNLIDNKYFISFIVAIIVFQITYGFVALNPTNINWLMSAYHDWGTHYLGCALNACACKGNPTTKQGGENVCDPKSLTSQT